jgi:2'-5' RNA ligase
MKRPRVLWIGVHEETGALATLQRDIEKSLAPLGFEPERRAYHPHLTLGRTRRGVRFNDQRKIGQVIASTDVDPIDELRVEAFRLMRSDLRPDGAVYTTLDVFSLGSVYEAR